MFYRVFTYSPEPLVGSDSACLVVTLDNTSLSRQLDVYLTSLWNEMIMPSHQEYIWTLALEWHHRKDFTDTTDTLRLLEDLSVGPLRPGASGRCLKHELPQLLESIFGQAGYFIVGPGRALTVAPSVDAANSILN